MQKELDRMEEYRMEQSADEKEPDEDIIMDYLAYMNKRTRFAAYLDLVMTTKEKAASGAGTLETAQSEENMACSLPSEHTTETEENQV